MKLNTLLISILSIVAVSSAVILNCSAVIDTHSVLSELYNATGGPTSWARKWNLTDPNYCDYEGINCASRYIDLPRNNMIGEIPDSFWCLDNFKAFNFTHNPSLRGNVSKIETLKYIQYLDLSWTHIYGELPSFVGSKLNESLKHLNLSYSCINGTIPPSMSQLSFLASIRMPYTALEGVIPVSFYALPAKELMLQCTNINATSFNLPLFRQVKGIPEVAAPDIHNSQCPEEDLAPFWCGVPDS